MLLEFQILSVTVIPMQYLIYSAHVTQIMNGLCGAVPYSAIMYISGEIHLLLCTIMYISGEIHEYYHVHIR